MTTILTDENFEQQINTSNIAIVDFFAPWCGPCKMMTPILEQVNEAINNDNNLANKVTLYKMNIDDNPKIPSEYGIMSIPTLILFKNGKPIESKLGVQQKNSMLEWINKHL